MKNIKSPKNMRFIKRVEKVINHPDAYPPYSEKTIEDHFYHVLACITLIRKGHWYKGGYVHTSTASWHCPELGGGNASIGYWIALARQRKPGHDKTKDR